MTTFSLKIELGNDAMQTGYDVGTALRDCAKRLDFDGLTVGTWGPIRDVNGNEVGGFEVVEESEGS
jgi:hypothetical protein